MPRSMQHEGRQMTQLAARPKSDSLADILERVLDKGVVIAGDIAINVLDIELLTLKIRLVVASVDTAKAMGIDWWTYDPFLSSRAAAKELTAENAQLRERLENLERLVAGEHPQGTPLPAVPPEREKK